MKRTRLFISYASEDSVAACWLARKLLCCGYSVWIDNQGLKGGHIWPSDIDDAIKNQSIRLIQLLSIHSLGKPNPVAERTLALSMEKEIPHFFIPLNCGLDSKKIPWQLFSVQYIDFSDLGKGFASLLNTLESDEIPKEFASNGLDIALSTFEVPGAILPQPEPVYSNAHRIISEPDLLGTFKSSHSLLRPELMIASRKYHWPVFFVNPQTFVSYFNPPLELATQFGIQRVENHETPTLEIQGVKTINIRKNLLLQSVQQGAIQKGFQATSDALLFPNLGPNRSRYTYTTWWGETTNIAPRGVKTAGGQKWHYTIGFRPRIMLVMDVFHCVLALHLGLRDEKGKPVDPKQVPAVRKSIMKSWWNDKISKVQCAIVSRMCDGVDCFGYSAPDGLQVRFSRIPAVGSSPTTINELVIDEIAKGRNTKTMADFKSDANRGKGVS